MFLPLLHVKTEMGISLPLLHVNTEVGISLSLLHMKTEVGISLPLLHVKTEMGISLPLLHVNILTSITCEDGMISDDVDALGRNLKTWNSAAKICSSVDKYETL